MAPTELLQEDGDLGGPQRLCGLALRGAEEPWLVVREALGWSWRSYGQGADQIARAVSVLQDLPNRSVVALAARGTEALLVDLTVRLAGHVSLPLSASVDALLPGSGGEERARKLGCAAWLEPPPRVEAPPPVSDFLRRLPAMRSRLEVFKPQQPAQDGQAGSVMLGDPPRLLQLSQKGMDRAVLAMDRHLVESLGRDPRWSGDHPVSGDRPAGLPRPVLWCAPGLDELGGRLGAAWALARGAMFSMPEQRPSFVDEVLWARPDVVLASASELLSLGEALRPRKARRWSRLRWAWLCPDRDRRSGWGSALHGFEGEAPTHEDEASAEREGPDPSQPKGAPGLSEQHAELRDVFDSLGIPMVLLQPSALLMPPPKDKRSGKRRSQGKSSTRRKNQVPGKDP